MNSHQVQLEVGARSETGYIRDENQDRMSGAQVPLGQLYLVADGMGGHKGGAVAAELTVQGLQQDIGEAQENVSTEEVIRAAFKKTNETVYQKAHSGDPATEGMGSTAVLLLISGRVAWVAHVGDSRAYLYRNGQLKQLTTDHTLVQKMVQAGVLKPEEAMDHPNASVLDRAMGNKPSVEVDISDKLPLSEGDAILLCSDGLSGYVADPEIETVLRSQATVQEIPEHLVQLTLQKGGEDNVTVQFIQYGTRNEVQSRRTKELETPALMRPMPVRRPLWQMAVVLILVMAISALGFYSYSRLRADKVDPRIEQVEQQLDAAKTAQTKAEDEVKTLQGKLEAAEAAKAKIEDDVKKLQGEVKTADAARIKAENDAKKLQGELETPKIAKAKIEDDVKKLQGEVKTADAARIKAENEVKTLQGKLEVADAARIRAENEVKNLQEKLKTVEAAQTKAENDAKKPQEESATAAQEVRKPKEEPNETEDQKVKPTASEEATKSEATGESGNTENLPGTDNTNP